ncbi:MAG: tetratricopeptide repeat protein, partial [Terriglobia bacterium]
MNRAPRPVGEHYSRKQVLRILGLSDRQLAAWERQGLVSPRSGASREDGPALPEGLVPSKNAPEDRPFSFADLVSLRTLLQLRREGVSPARIRSFHAALKARLAGIQKPWSELQVRKHGKRLCVQLEGAPLEPITGQFLLEYAPRHPTTAVRTLEHPARTAAPGEVSAELRADRFFRAGLRYEECRETFPKAIRAYRRAIELDQRAAGAWVNLGTLYYNLGQLDEAERCYRAVLSFDPGYALAHFNLGNVFDERKEWKDARGHYEEAVRLSPR